MLIPLIVPTGSISPSPSISDRLHSGLGRRPQWTGGFLATDPTSDRGRGACLAASDEHAGAADPATDGIDPTACRPVVVAAADGILQRKGHIMNWNLARGLVCLAFLAASGLTMAGLSDFDMLTGSFDLRPFNLYALTGTAGGVIFSALASVALWRGWGRK